MTEQERQASRSWSTRRLVLVGVAALVVMLAMGLGLGLWTRGAL